MLELKSFIVYSESEIKILNANQLNEVFKLQSEKEVVFLQNPITELTAGKLIPAISSNDHQKVKMILEHCDLELQPEEAKAFEVVSKVFESLKKKEKDRPYPWSFPVENYEEYCKDLYFTKISISRGGYNIGLKTAKRLWDEASKYWASSVANTVSTSVKGVAASGYKRSAVIRNSGVSIGCQTIPRVEIEAIAIKLGWAPAN